MQRSNAEMMNQLWDSSNVVVKKEPEDYEDSENIRVEEQENPNIHADINFVHIEIKSEEHESLSDNDIDSQNEPSQCTDLLEETDKETSSHNLAKDKSSSSLKKIIKCDQCDFTTVSRKYFVVHLRRHTGVRPYACDECDYSSVEKSAIKRHKKLHLEIKPYNCDMCEFSCADRSSLTRHNKRHTGLKLFQCDQCIYSCSQQRYLTRHKMIHLDIKPYQCTECSFTSADESSFIRHKKIHVGLEIFTCDECGVSFAQHCTLQRHKKARHTANHEAAALSCEFGSKRDFNSTTTDYNMQNPAESKAIEVNVKVEFEEHPIDVKPELDQSPNFDRHYVFLPEGPTMDVDLHSAYTTVHVNVKQESDPFTAAPSVDTESGSESVSGELWSNSEVVVKSEPEESEDSQDITIEQNMTTETSIQPLEENIIEQKPKISAETHICHIVGDAAFSRNDNDPEAGPSQNIDPLNQNLLPPRDFSCNVCTYKGTTRRNLTKHKRRHFSEKKHQCSQCDFRTQRRSDLVSHMRSHSGERPYECDICTYRGATSSGLSKHKLRHTQEKKFQCSVCDFKSHEKNEFVIHLRVHSGERPYACDVCEFKCSSSSSLTKHKKIHLQLKPHQCDMCSYSCADHSNLRRHKKRHHQ